MKHKYRDRWFADPFIVEETADTYIILVEEYMYSTRLGRLARLTVSKDECELLKNDTILDVPTHLSFPNFINVNGKQYIYPENAKNGKTTLYTYGKELQECGVLSELPLADAVVANIEEKWYLFATIGDLCNGNVLDIYCSSNPLSGYVKVQEIKFVDNVARRAGNLFLWQGKLISPAQICNEDYGQGVSLQEVTIGKGKISLNEIKRMYPPTQAYSEGFHTYNVFNKKVVIDGYRYGSKFLHNLYFKLRTI